MGYYALEVNIHKMVKQAQGAKTSSRNRRRSEYELPSYIVGGGLLPKTIETAVGPDPSTGDPGYYVISGTFYPEDLNEAEALASLREAEQDRWLEPPHIAFANLRADDPQSVEAFVKRYGVLRYLGRPGILLSDSPTRTILPPRTFRIEASGVKEAQLTLQASWETAVAPDSYGAFPIDSMKVGALEGLEVSDLVKGSVQIKARDVLTLISFLFLRDYTRGRLGICGNPDCPARYFRKNRRTQKFCEQGPCVAYAQRQYSLGWWNRVGKKKRGKKMKLQSKRSK